VAVATPAQEESALKRAANVPWWLPTARSKPPRPTRANQPLAGIPGTKTGWRLSESSPARLARRIARRSQLRFGTRAAFRRTTAIWRRPHQTHNRAKAGDIVRHIPEFRTRRVCSLESEGYAARPTRVAKPMIPGRIAGSLLLDGTKQTGYFFPRR
jgi:hypothetical protein